MNTFHRKLNSFYFHYKKWRIRFKVEFINKIKEQIPFTPVFLIGVGGGGLTLLHRILSRHTKVVYVTGNYKYWAGADEMQSVLFEELPQAFSFKEGYYVDNKNLLNAKVNNADKKKMIEIIKKIIYINKPKEINEKLYFIDKSQLFTLRVKVLQEIFKNYNPKFVLIIRNPYAWCWRAVERAEIFSKKEQEKEVQKAANQWNHSFTKALQYENDAEMVVHRFEDLLQEPYSVVKDICEFIGLDFQEDILPKKDDKIPFGSAFDAHNKHKWYPLRPNVNRRYLENIPQWAIKVINKKCGNLAERFNYTSKVS